MASYWGFVATSLIFVSILGLNLWVGFTPFTLACVVFTGLMLTFQLIMIIKE